MNESIRNTIQRLEEYMAERTDALAIPREAGAFMHTLVLASRATRGVEIGTSYGYSGLWIAAAMQTTGGRLITIDRERRKSEAAAANFADAGLGERVVLETGVALEVLGRLEGPFDFVFVDADKENCIAYVQAVEPKLSDGAVVLTDNTLTHAEELAGFLAWIRNHARFASAHLTIGNGMELSVRIPEGDG
ncbi:MAG: DUF1442 domain-containing protein [bacterium]|nr:DUF1442 domain-containing protein [bacterium]